jgi:Cu(I)/Ag(I) efflux system membrane protein CusA/SilA
MSEPYESGLLNRLIRFCLENKLVVTLLVGAVIVWGVLVAPFDWKLEGIPRNPVPVDAIPDYGENQQIVFTEWAGRSPQDVEDQVTYPLTVALLGMPGVKTVRSFSYFGFSSIYVIFKEDVEFYWSRTRVLEKLASLSAGTLPERVQPTLGPDATPLGQIYWYTLEGRDPDGNPVGGWDLEELRSVQDWDVRFKLMAVDGVSEVASVGGFVREYQIDVDPDAMRAHGVRLDEVFEAVRMSNVDVGARTIEVNRVEYVIRGVGFLKSVGDIEETVIKVNENVPIRVADVATVSEGPALRRGALDKEGTEAVGGVVVVRYGENPLATIRRLKEKIREISGGLPRKSLADGTVSQVTLVPFYDRTGLIYETLGTLNAALTEEILVTIIVVLLMVMHLKSSILISGLLPLAVLMCFIAMKSFGVDANVVALSGIAIAIGTMVDMGVVICENILKHLEAADAKESRLEVIYRASTEVAGAILTAILTTVVSFLPVFTMEAAEGKLFKPLAFTKTFALISSVIVALVIIPPFAHILFTGKIRRKALRLGISLSTAVLGLWVGFRLSAPIGAVLFLFGAWNVLQGNIPERFRRWGPRAASTLAVLVALGILTEHWLPLGPEKGFTRNLVFVGVLLVGVFLIFAFFQRRYEAILRYCLRHKALFLSLPTLLVLVGLTIWLGGDRLFGFLPRSASVFGIEESSVRGSAPWSWLSRTFPGLGKEFMPKLSEGSFLYMPSTMPHASIGEAMDSLKKQDMAIRAIPEVELVVGKIGRAESPLDPAPISMVETIITFKPEYIVDTDGRRVPFRYDDEEREYVRDAQGKLIPDASGRPFRQWRDEIVTEDDIWREIEKAGRILGSTAAPKLQPIETRLIMLQTGMRAPMGIKVFGPDLPSIERAGFDIERLLRELPSIKPETVNADRVIGKPYLEIDIDRRAISRYGISVRRVQDVIEVAVGGKRITTTVEGRQRFPVRVRYLRELRDTVESLERILVPAPDGTHVPLSQIAKMHYRRGPMVIKSEDTSLVSYVTFDKQEDIAEVTAVEQAQAHLKRAEEEGRFSRPEGVTYRFTGSYENQIRSTKRMMIVLPLTLFIIFMILYFQFKSTVTTLLVFAGVFVAWSGGFQMLWLYDQDWFLNFPVFGENLRDIFHIRSYNLSVAVWVGFLALFGIATDDGVILTTYLNQTFDRRRPQTKEDIREAVVEAGKRRIRPCLMTSATTILALIPVLTSIGRGADVMVPMAIPSVGGMAVVLLTVFTVPTLYCLKEEWKLR